MPLLGFIVGVCTFLILRFIFTRPVYLYNHEEGWININDMPIPENTQYLATDGNETEHFYSIHYNSKGKPVMGFRHRLIAYWKPMPKPPRRR